MLRQRFGLNSADETVVDQFVCVNSKMASGWLYVTSSFICFDTFLQQNDGRLAFKIEDVREVKKHKFAKVVDNGIKFVMKTGKVGRIQTFGMLVPILLTSRRFLPTEILLLRFPETEPSA